MYLVLIMNFHILKVRLNQSNLKSSYFVRFLSTFFDNRYRIMEIVEFYCNHGSTNFRPTLRTSKQNTAILSEYGTPHCCTFRTIDLVRKYFTCRPISRYQTVSTFTFNQFFNEYDHMSNIV